MKTPSKETIEQQAHIELKKEAGSPFTAFIRGAEWMEEQLEPIITELEMSNLRMTEAIISMIDKSTDTRVVNIGLKAINKTIQDLYPPKES